MNSHTFILDQDLEVSLEKLVQQYTYGGLIEGLPGEMVNRMVLQNIEQSARADLHLEQIYTLLPGEMSMEFPAVVCMARLEYRAVFKDTKKDYSGLGVIWFQDEFAFPIEHEILKQLKTVPFRELCVEFEY